VFLPQNNPFVAFHTQNWYRLLQERNKMMEELPQAHFSSTMSAKFYDRICWRVSPVRHQKYFSRNLTLAK